MLFGVHYHHEAHGDEARDRRTAKLIEAWEPPTGCEITASYSYADGSGGLFLIDVPSGEALLEALSPWNTFAEVEIKPLVAEETARAISAKAAAWRDSVK